MIYSDRIFFIYSLIIVLIGWALIKFITRFIDNLMYHHFKLDEKSPYHSFIICFTLIAIFIVLISYSSGLMNDLIGLSREGAAETASPDRGTANLETADGGNTALGTANLGTADGRNGDDQIYIPSMNLTPIIGHQKSPNRPSYVPPKIQSFHIEQVLTGKKAPVYKEDEPPVCPNLIDDEDLEPNWIEPPSPRFSKNLTGTDDSSDF